jgi:Sigma-70, region 4
MTQKKLDNSWGSEGVALLPRSLCTLWTDEPLPEWVAKELHLAAEASAAALDQSVWASSGTKTVSDRLRNFILNLVNARRSEIRSERVFAQSLPYWLNLKELPFSTRTRNCLVFAGLLSEPEQASNVTFGRLFDIRSMGAVSILEFACLAEAALEQASSPAIEPSPSTDDALLSIVSEDWVDQVGPADPRFSDIIPPISHATVLELLDSLTSGPDADRQALENLTQAIPELRKRTSQIKVLPLELQLNDFLRALTRFDGKRLSALMDRFGWSGSEALTLEEAGSRLGVTRERMRQLQERVTNRLKEISFPVYMPALDDALRLLRDKCPIGVGDAASLLKASGLSKVNFHPASLIAAAEACGRKPPISLQTVGKRTIVATTDIPSADAILRIAYRQAHASGASNVGEVHAELSASGIEVDISSVGHALQEFSEVEFLEEQWFGHRPSNPERDRLRNTTRKMLSVAAPIELSSLREGIRREYRYRGHRGLKTWALLVPPRSVLRHYFKAHPEFEIDENDLVRPVEPLDYRTELALNDAILVDVLRSSPASVLDRASLWRECERRAMNVNTFSVYLSYSAVIVHLGTDIWTLRGVRVDPAAVEALLQANALRQKEKRVLDHGWTAAGQLWVATRLPGTLSGAFIFGMPGAIKRYLAGRKFAAKDDDGIEHGSVRINDEGSSYGFGPFLRQRGADEGDILIAEFDLNGGTALLRLGDDELLDEISPET